MSPVSLPPAGPEPPQDRSLDSLEPEAFKVAVAFLISAARDGHALRITETRRSRQRQAWLWSIGRTHCHPVTGSTAKLTNAPPGSSNHETGMAIDVVPMRASPTGAAGHYKPAAWYDCPYWEEIGKIGESCGLSWGGRWTNPDKPHFEYKP